VSALPQLEDADRPPPDREELRGRLLVGCPVADRRLEVAGARTALLEAGDGRPLVLLHGGIECGGVYWAHVIGELAADLRLVVPDVPGLGESAPLERHRAAAFADWLAALIEATCDEEPVLVAHSLLGTVAAEVAVRRGDLLRGLVIYATPGIARYRMPLGFRVAAVRFGLRPTERNIESFERWAFHDLDRTRARDPAWFEAFDRYLLARARVPHGKRTMRELIRLGTKQVPEPRLRRIAVPTVLVWGQGDRMVPLAIAEQARETIGWPLDVIDDAGHVPHIERPEAFVRALRPALASAGRS
jgi:2-hydroxymuconate-semialdehyde hydrolase